MLITIVNVNSFFLLTFVIDFPVQQMFLLVSHSYVNCLGLSLASYLLADFLLYRSPNSERTNFEKRTHWLYLNAIFLYNRIFDDKNGNKKHLDPYRVFMHDFGDPAELLNRLRFVVQYNTIQWIVTSLCLSKYCWSLFCVLYHNLSQTTIIFWISKRMLFIYFTLGFRRRAVTKDTFSGP